jgi:hypothetical protein
MNLAGPPIDIGLFTNRRDARLLFRDEPAAVDMSAVDLRS